MASNGNGKPSKPPMDWETNPRWAGITRPYSMQEVERLRGSVHIEHTLARLGAERLWNLLQSGGYVAALGAMTGNQAIQQVKAGLQAIYVSGWQVAADANDAGQMYPDQSLYPADSVPNLVRRINQALTRADQIHHAEGKNGIHWFAPMVADAEAGFGGNLNAFELMKAMIEAGAACVHFRRPAFFREKVRPHGRQSSGADGRSHPEVGGGSPGSRRSGRAHADHGSHRRRQRPPAYQRH